MQKELKASMIEGTVTVSIDTFEKLKKALEEKEAAEQTAEKLKKRIRTLFTVDDTEWKKAMQEIDKDNTLTDRQVERKVSEAYEKLLVYISKHELMKLVRMSITKEKGITDNPEQDIKRATDSELDAIQVEWEEGE